MDQRIAHLAPQLVIVVRRPGEILAVEEDRRPFPIARSVGRWAEEPQDAGRERWIRRGEVRHLGQIDDGKVRPLQPRLDVRRKPRDLLLYDARERGNARCRSWLERLRIELLCPREMCRRR